MPDRDKVIKGLECCTQHGSMCGSDCNGHYERYTDDGYVIKLVDEYRSECPYGKCETGCVKTLAKDALELLKEQEPNGVKPIKVDQWNSVCGACGEPVEYPYGGADDWLIAHFDFCQRCGRRVKWDD